MCMPPSWRNNQRWTWCHAFYRKPSKLIAHRANEPCYRTYVKTLSTEKYFVRSIIPSSPWFLGLVAFFQATKHPPFLSHPVFKAKTRCSSYVCPGSSCHTYGQNVSTEYQWLYYIVSYYKNLLQVQKGLNSGMDPILTQTVDRGFRMPRRNLHQCTPHPLSSRT
jgi:hypothetical protein